MRIQAADWESMNHVSDISDKDWDPENTKNYKTAAIRKQTSIEDGQRMWIKILLKKKYKASKHMKMCFRRDGPSL